MRVLITTDYFYPHIGGGVEKVLAEVAPRLAAMGHHVRVVTLTNRAGLSDGMYRGVEVRRIAGLNLDRLTGLQLRVSPSMVTKMRAEIAEFQPDVVSINHVFFTTSVAAMWWAQRLGIPKVLTLHIADVRDIPGWRGSAAAIYERTVGRSLIEKADGLIAVSEAVGSAVAEFVHSPVWVVPNGVDTRQFHPRSDNDFNELDTIFVGRLIQNKGPDIALKGFAEIAGEFPSASLTFVGEGPLRPLLEKFAKQWSIRERVAFLGAKPNVRVHLQEADVFIRPSLVEGMPLTVLEAMACGLPVIASSAGGVAEVVDDGRTGILVEPGSTTAVAAALQRLLNDRELRRGMSRAARRSVVDRFTWEQTANLTVQALEFVAK